MLFFTDSSHLDLSDETVYFLMQRGRTKKIQRKTWKKLKRISKHFKVWAKLLVRCFDLWTRNDVRENKSLCLSMFGQNIFLKE
jgi:hypothetical protein